MSVQKRPPNHPSAPWQYPPPMPYPAPMPIRIPYFIPQHLASPHIVIGPSMDIVDKKMSNISFDRRPGEYKFMFILVLVLTVLTTSWNVFALTFWTINYYAKLFMLTLVLMINMYGFVSIMLLWIPKKIGWYFSLTTCIMILPIFGFLTLFSFFDYSINPVIYIILAIFVCTILLLITLHLPSNRFYFHTGEISSKPPSMSAYPQ